ncbi:MAG: alpha-ketoglutarate-dependent dioxygenase AlkB [Beijerinckiaceae bacterium]|nr:alpha-ketoglutarate-dependent dioxygenase AlkB [Beijerinckiaceae bacterium]
MIELAPGLRHLPEFLDRAEQEALVADLRRTVAAAPLFTPRMPRTGKEFSVRMSNCGPLGWVSDAAGGYRYQAAHPETGAPWPAIPALALKCWEAGGYAHAPEACLVNFYDAAARMGLHQDRDEAALDAPVVSISLGDSCLFRFGGNARGSSTKSVRLHSGDLVLIGGDSRLCFHGVDRIMAGSSTLLPNGGRINLTLRRVTQP